MCKPYIVVARAVVTMTSENRYLQKRNRVLFLDLMIIACLQCSWLKCHRDLQTGTLCMNDTRVRCAHRSGSIYACNSFKDFLSFTFFNCSSFFLKHIDIHEFRSPCNQNASIRKQLTVTFSTGIYFTVE